MTATEGNAVSARDGRYGKSGSFVILKISPLLQLCKQLHSSNQIGLLGKFHHSLYSGVDKLMQCTAIKHPDSQNLPRPYNSRNLAIYFNNVATF